MLIICQIDWREVGVAFELQCLRNCTLSSLKMLQGPSFFLDSLCIQKDIYRVWYIDSVNQRKVM